MDMTYIDYEIDKNGIGMIVLNRPTHANALSNQMINEFAQALLDAERDPKCRVVVISAKGPSFCSGYDLEWVAEMVQKPQDQNVKEGKQNSQLHYILYSLKKPTIALVHGTVIAVGLGLAACCDIVIADPKTTFSSMETRIGIFPALATSYLIAAIGPRETKRIILTGDTLNAEYAQKIGLVHYVVPKRELKAKALEIAKRILVNGPQAIAGAKQHIDSMLYRPINESLAMENAMLITAIGVSYEAQEGIRAFIERKPAPWMVRDDGE